MKTFDRVFITHMPSFYKVNLYHHLAKKCQICVIFIAKGSSDRPDDFSKALEGIPHFFLNEGAFEKRSRYLSCLKIRRIMRSIKAKEWVVGGWDLPEFWMSALLHPRANNSVVVESTYKEAGWLKMLMKRCFIKRMGTAYASGNAQIELLEKLNFKGTCIKTGGVGVVDWHAMSLFRKKAESFIFVGRFVPEKNLPLLLAAFKQCLNLKLTLVGDGPLAPALKATASNNIQFIPYTDHALLPKLLAQHDVLILPSHQEAWGIVVEEAQLCGLPVIVSSAVGCCAERVQHLGAGLVFQNGSLQSLVAAIQKVQDPQIYQLLLKRVSVISFEMIKDKQVKSYTPDYEDIISP